MPNSKITSADSILRKGGFHLSFSSFVAKR